MRYVRAKQVMYMTFYNDLARLVDDTIIIVVEHQSTMNRNMPLLQRARSAKFPAPLATSAEREVPRAGNDVFVYFHKKTA